MLGSRHDLRTFLAIAVVVLSCISMLTSQDAAVYSFASLQGKVVQLRSPLRSKVLAFGSDGNSLGRGEAGGWPSDSTLRVDKVKDIVGGVELDCSRVTIFYDEHGEGKAVLTGYKTRLTIETGSGSGISTEVANRVFVLTGHSPAAVVPPDLDALRAKYGRKYTTIKAPTQVATLPSGEPVYLAAGGVTLPAATYDPDPQYAEQLRAVHQAAFAVLRAIVDASGAVLSIQVIRSSDVAFRNAALEAVALWRFHPATLGGKPVASAVEIHLGVAPPAAPPCRLPGHTCTPTAP